MSNEIDEFDDEESDSKLVKDLRKQVKELKAAKDAAEAVAAEAAEKSRAATVAELLKAKTGKPQLAKFYTGDSSEDAVNQWITENADVLGLEVPDENGPSAEELAAAARVSQATATGQTQKIGSPESFLQEMQAASTPEELKAVYAKYGH